MAKPPRQSGQRVTFTPSAAKRIARVVRMVEGGDRSIPAAGMRTGSDDGDIVRGTFTGAWAKGSTKTVTDATLTSVTYEAKNYSASTDAGASPQSCVIAYVAGEWVLVSADAAIVRGTFTAPWTKGSTKTVTDAVTSGKSYSNVMNYFAAVGGTGTKACAIAYVGSEWILIAAEC